MYLWLPYPINGVRKLTYEIRIAVCKVYNILKLWNLHYFRFVKNNLRLPAEFMNHESFSHHEIQAFLWDSESLLGPDWMLAYIHVRNQFLLIWQTSRNLFKKLII